jgi:hypothetical protein
MAANLGNAVRNIGSATTGALEVSTRAVDQSVKLVGSAVNQGGAVANAALEGAGAVATSAIQNTTEVATDTLSAAKDVSKVGLKTTTTVVESAGEITNAAAKTSADIATVTIGTVGVVAKDANKTIQLSSALATGLTNNVLEGITNMNQILGGAGENQVIAIRNTQESTKAVLTSGIGSTASTKQKLDSEFNKFVVNMKTSVKQLIKLQASSINSVRVFIVKFYCTGMFARLFRSQCPPQAETNAAKMEMSKASRQLQVLSTTLLASFEKSALDTQAKIKLIPITDTQAILTAYKALFEEYCAKIATSMEAYTTSTNAILEKHNALLKKITDDEVVGGRRKRTRRRRSRRRSTLREASA